MRDSRVDIVDRIRAMVTQSPCTLRLALISIALSAAAEAQIPPLASDVQRSIQRIVGVTGSYIQEEEAFKVRIPRSDVVLRVGDRRFSGVPVESWAGFAVEIHREGLLTGELSLLDDEVTPVVAAALDSGLQVTGLANSTLFEQQHVLTLNVWAVGPFDKLASGFRRCLDAIRTTRLAKLGRAAPPNNSEIPAKSAIDAAPINAILSMKGTVTNGIYRAAIGRVTLLNGTPIGREMGATTWVLFAGTNSTAVLQSELVVTGDELQRVLKALRTKGLSLTSIRNHTVGEHPQLVFVRLSGQGAAADLAKALRYALDVEVGAVKPPPQGRARRPINRNLT